MPWYRIEDCNRENIERLGGRLHQKVNGRYVTVLLHNDQLFCIDSCCYHASGPVGEGPVTDIEDIPTIRCLWHNMIFALDTGERVTQELLLPGEAQGKVHRPISMAFPLRPQGTTGKVKRSGESMQRVHSVREIDYGDKGVDRERWPVEVELLDNDQYPFSVPSDKTACNPQYAKMCMTIQQQKIDTPAQTAQEGGGGAIKNSFARTLLHTLQTSAIGLTGKGGGGGAAAVSVVTKNGNSNNSYNHINHIINSNNNNNNRFHGDVSSDNDSCGGTHLDSPVRSGRSNEADLEFFTKHTNQQQQQHHQRDNKAQEEDDDDEDCSSPPCHGDDSPPSPFGSTLPQHQYSPLCPSGESGSSTTSSSAASSGAGVALVHFSQADQYSHLQNYSSSSISSSINNHQGDEDMGSPLSGPPPGNARAPTPPPARR